MKSDFSRIINESVRITRSNKKLWVLGFVLAAMAGGSSGSYNQFSQMGDFTPPEDKPSKEEYKYPSNADPRELLNSNLLGSYYPQVLGAATASLPGLVKTIPVHFYLTLVLLIITGLSIGVTITLYARSWSESSLIHGIDRESVGESLGLAQMSDHGKKNAMEVIKIRIIPGLLLFVVSVVTAVFIGILAAVLPQSGRALIVILAIPLLIFYILVAIYIVAGTNLGVLAINLNSLSWKPAFNKGLKIFRTYFIDVLIVFLINCFTLFMLSIAVFLTFLILGMMGAAAALGVSQFPPLLVAVAPLTFLVVLAVIILSGLVGGILMVFKQSTWVILYKQLTEEPSGQQ